MHHQGTTVGNRFPEPGPLKSGEPAILSCPDLISPAHCYSPLALSQQHFMLLYAPIFAPDNHPKMTTSPDPNPVTAPARSRAGRPQSNSYTDLMKPGESLGDQTDATERRKIKNRLAQRAYRECTIPSNVLFFLDRNCRPPGFLFCLQLYLLPTKRTQHARPYKRGRVAEESDQGTPTIDHTQNGHYTRQSRLQSIITSRSSGHIVFAG